MLSGLGGGAALLVGPADEDELRAGARYPTILLSAGALERDSAAF